MPSVPGKARCVAANVAFPRQHLLCALLAVSVLCGCGSTVPVQRSQKITVQTDPPDAELFVLQGETEKPLGKAPVTFDEPYTAMKFESTPACWLTPLAGAGLMGAAVYVGLDAGGSPEPTGGIIGAALLGTVGVMLTSSFGIVRCVMEANQDGAETPVAAVGLPRELEARAPGRAPQRLLFPEPGPDRKVSLSFSEAGVGGASSVAGGASLPRPAAGAPGPGRLAAGAPQPNAFALIIGVEKYRDLPPPTGARGDAQQFAELAKKTLGVPERNVILALDDRAAKSDLEKHLGWLEKNVPAGGRIYLFFAGHGAPDPTSGTSYLLPYDADPAALQGTALRLSEITARLGRTKAHDVVAFLDSCFSGTGGRSVIAAGTRPLVPVAKLDAAPKVSILAAVTGAQTSGAHVAGGGLFSHFLLEALGNGRADHDGDGQITLGELNEWIGPRVEKEARRDSRDQRPSLTVGAGVDAATSAVAVGVSGG